MNRPISIVGAVLLGLFLSGTIMWMIEIGFKAYERRLRRSDVIIDLRCPECGFRFYEQAKMP